MSEHQQVWDGGWRDTTSEEDWYSHSSRRTISEKDLKLMKELEDE